jgi:hypothetical protein
MKKLIWSTCAAFLTFAAVFPCFAADSPWSGTWKENLAKGKLTGQTMTITAKGSGYHFSNGATSYDFACDGKPYPTSGNVTIACTPTSDGGFDFTQAAGDKVVMKQHRTFSADGKDMTMDSTAYHPDGSTAKIAIVRHRTSGTTGLVGEWVNAKVEPTEPGVRKISVDGDMLHIEMEHGQATVDAKLDGSDAKVTGPTVSADQTGSFKAVSPNELTYTHKVDGKVTHQGTMTLSADGKTLTDVEWIPGRETEKTTEVFEKQ